MKIYIFACAYDDSGVDVDILSVSKSIDKVKKDMLEYYWNTCNFPYDEALQMVDETVLEGYYDMTDPEFDVPSVYRLESFEV